MSKSTNSRYDVRMRMGEELGIAREDNKHPLRVLKQMYEDKFGEGVLVTNYPRFKGKKASVTGGKIDASKFPSEDLLDKNGKPLMGFALEKRVQKLSKGKTVTATPVADKTDNVRFEKIEHSVGQLTDVVKQLTQAFMDSKVEQETATK